MECRLHERLARRPPQQQHLNWSPIAHANEQSRLPVIALLLLLLLAVAQTDAKSADLPDSVYKVAPLLFGADLMSDYFNEPAPDRRQAPPTTQLDQQQQQQQRAKAAVKSGAQAQAPTSTRRPMTPAAQPTGKPAAKESERPSMDHVLSSLGLVVEAMKQQTMAMQMISGQMAAAKVPESPAETRALLESFGEMLGGLRSARAAAKEPQAVKGARPIDEEEPVQLATTQASPTTSPTTSTTTTLAPTSTSSSTTPAPSTSAASTTSQPPSSSTSRAPDTSTTSKGWRRVVPFDFYPTQKAPEPASRPLEFQPDSATFGHSLADNYRSVALGANYGQPVQPTATQVMQPQQMMLIQHLMQQLAQPAASPQYRSRRPVPEEAPPTAQSLDEPAAVQSSWRPMGEHSPEQPAGADEAEQLSDEIPRPPGLVQRPTKTAPKPVQGALLQAMQQQALRIGERPKFDLANFQLLSDMAAQMAAATPATKSGVRAAASDSASLAQEAPESGDLSGSASSQAAAKSVGQRAPEAEQQQRPAGAPKSTSFSILGGRFKITPHTQMLQLLLEPSKALLSSALGQLMAPGQPQLVGPAPPTRLAAPGRRPAKARKSAKPAKQTKRPLGKQRRPAEQPKEQ